MALLTHRAAVFATAFCYRIFWALIISTSFVPDEYYQTIHPANILNEGSRSVSFRNTWEWQDEFRIRSFVPILPYLLFYHLRNISRSYIEFLSSEIVIVQGSQLLNAITSSCSDFALYTIVLRMSHSNALSICILLTHLLSWSASYCLSRTLANSTETALVIIGLYLWISEHRSGVGVSDEFKIESVESLNEGTTKKNKGHMDQNRKGLRMRKSVIIQSTGNILDDDQPRKKEAHACSHSIAIIVIVVTIHCRPTAVLFWAPLIILRACQEKSPLTYVLVQYFPGALVSFIVCVAVDSICYGEFTVTPYNFFLINVVRNYAVLFYGAKSYAWNFNHGLPVMLGLYTPILLYGLLFTHQPTEAIILELVSFLYMILLRCVTAHQEYRFLLPCLPFFHIAVGCTIWNFAVWCLPSLGRPTGYPYSFRTYCLSFFFPSISQTAKIGSTEYEQDKRPLEKESYKQPHSRDLRPIDSSDGSSEKVGSTHPCIKMALLSIVFLMAAAHVGTALYLCTRHQRGAQVALIQISRAVNREYMRSSPSAPSPPCNVTVLQLAPCHSFPGFSLLPALIERTGCTVHVFSPDCSPSARSDTANLSRITESKAFELSPAIFISNEEFWSKWQDADYIVTYNSYVDLLWPFLESKGFTPLSNFSNADFRYDYDEPLFHHTVHLFDRKREKTAP